MQPFGSSRSDELSEEEIAFAENGLRNLEYLLLAKQDYVSVEEREQVLSEFYSLAEQMREVHRLARLHRQ